MLLKQYTTGILLVMHEHGQAVVFYNAKRRCDKQVKYCTLYYDKQVKYCTLYYDKQEATWCVAILVRYFNLYCMGRYCYFLIVDN